MMMQSAKYTAVPHGPSGHPKTMKSPLQAGFPYSTAVLRIRIPTYEQRTKGLFGTATVAESPLSLRRKAVALQ
jgi:hypothetical protein